MEFKAKIETVHSVHSGEKIETLTFFHCAACGLLSTVEEDLGLCRPCWRLVVMIGEIARELRGETPKRKPRPALILPRNAPSARCAPEPRDSLADDAQSVGQSRSAKERGQA